MRRRGGCEGAALGGAVGRGIWHGGGGEGGGILVSHLVGWESWGDICLVPPLHYHGVRCTGDRIVPPTRHGQNHG